MNKFQDWVIRIGSILIGLTILLGGIKMPFTLNGRALIYILLFAVGAAIIAVLAMLALNLVFWLIGHRRYVPWAKLLRFKRDDMEKTSQQVNEILGEKNGKKSKGRKRNN